MATVAAERLMTAEEFLALPTDDSVERMLIRGEVWEKPMTRRNRFHSGTEAAVAYLLTAWLRTRPQPRGRVFSGEAGVRLTRDPDSIVGIDVAYFSPEQLRSAESADTTLLVGPPTLAVEILSPSDRIDEIQAKLDEYLGAGVPIVWVVDPHFKAVTVYRPGQGPVTLHGEALMQDETHLPGFRVAVAELFPEDG